MQYLKNKGIGMYRSYADELSGKAVYLITRHLLQPTIMNKRSFLKLSSTLMAAPFIAPLIKILPDGEKLQNWAGNFTFSTDRVFYPETLEQVLEMVIKHKRIKVLGTRHCFNRIADSTDNLLSMKHFNKIISLDEKAGTVTVESGIKYGELAPYLEARGYALHNLASLPHITVMGACTTATHGSGIHNGNLSTAITAIEMVKADGTVLHLNSQQNGEDFYAAVVGLGALGVITKVTLQLVPSFTIRQDVYEQLPMDQLENHFDEIVSAGYSVSLFTDWQSNFINEVWVKSKTGPGSSFNLQNNFFGAKAANRNIHPIISLGAENCTEQMGVPGPWYERLPHFKMGFTPSSGKELQSEYFVPKEHAINAIKAVASLGSKVTPHLMITEIRTIAADNFWMSPCYKQDCVTIHFTLQQDIPEVNALLTVIEKVLEPFNPKPHWGKLFNFSARQLHARYPKMDAFVSKCREYDPKGKFRNQFLADHLMGI
jgi:xylitol oxidase